MLSVLGIFQSSPVELERLLLTAAYDAVSLPLGLSQLEQLPHAVQERAVVRRCRRRWRHNRPGEDLVGGHRRRGRRRQRGEVNWWGVRHVTLSLEE